MRRFGLAFAAVGLVALAGGSQVHADGDTVRLGTSSAGTLSGGTDTALVRWGFRGGFGRGFYGRGFYGRGFWGRGFYGRGFWGRGFYGRGFYRPYWGGYYGRGFYRPYGIGIYGGFGLYTPYYGVCASPLYASYYPIAGQGAVTQTLAATTASSAVSSNSTTSPQVLHMPGAAPQQPKGNQTFPYDGGPQNPPPFPGNDAVDPASNSGPTVSPQGKLVYLPIESGVGSTQLTTHFVGLAAGPMPEPEPDAAPAPRRSGYAAYGEQPLPPVTRRK